MKSKFSFMSSIVLVVVAFLSGCASNSPLLLAAAEGNKTEVKELLNKGADVNEISGEGGDTPLIAASGRGHLDIVRDLIKAGASVNIKNENGETALSWAAWKCYPAIIQVLLDHGADVNVQNKGFGSTPLMFATDCDDVASVKALLAKGANPNARNGEHRDGRSALYFASKAGNWEIVRILLEEKWPRNFGQPVKC